MENYEEYYYDNYYIIIGITKENNIIIKVINLEFINNNYYEKIFNLNDVSEIIENSLQNKKLEEIYEFLISIFKTEKFYIDSSKPNNDDNFVILNIVLDKKKEIKLNKVMITNLIEYSKYLSIFMKKIKNELNLIKQTQNRDKYQNSTDLIHFKEENKNIEDKLREIMEENISIKKELIKLKNIIQEKITNVRTTVSDSNDNNKYVTNNLNICNSKEKKDIKEIKLFKKKSKCLSINEFNKIFKINITDNNITELKLGYKNLGQNKVKNLTMINFENLEKLWLSNNKINDINFLEELKYPALQTLDLSNNQIENINVFENTNFKNLRKLWLNNNLINDISVFMKVKCERLEELNLKNNKISNIGPLEKIEFTCLNCLDLTGNKIDVEITKNKDICNNMKAKIKYFSV